MEKVEIEVTRAFCIGGERQEVGSRLPVDKPLAIELCALGKAVPAKSPAPASRKPIKEKTE